MEKQNIKHIVFTGPESSGKTTLAKAFSLKTDSYLVEEYAREYLVNKINYVKSDLLEIAKGQQKLIDLAIKNNHITNKSKLIISDTDLLTIKIWSEYKYGSCNDWIISTLVNNLPNLYILCRPDFPWQDDPLRENPKDRDELYEIYLAEIKKLNLPFIEVGGSVEERFGLLEELLKN